MKIVLIASVPESIISFRGNLIKRFLESLDEVHIIAPFKDSDKNVVHTLQSWGVKIHKIELEKSVHSIVKDATYFFHLFKLIKKITPDIVLSYTIKPVIYGSIISGFLRINRTYSLITGLGSNFIGKKTISTYLLIWLYKIAISFNKKVFFQNKDDENYFYENKIIKSLKKSVIVNGSGVDLDFYKFSKIPNKHSILLIARLLKNKGIHEYVESAKIIKEYYPNIKFKIAGGFEKNIDSIDKDEFNDWIKSGYIDYLGSLDDVRPAISDCTIFVLPSYREGTPRSVLEAMSIGRAIITTDAPGCRETVIDGENGFLIPPKNVKLLSDAIKKLIDDLSLCESFGLRSREYVVSKFDQNIVSKNIIKNMDI